MAFTYVPGATLSIDTAGGTSYTQRTNIVSIERGDETREACKTTDLDSTYDTFIAGSIANGGKLKAMIRFVQAQHLVLRTAFLANTVLGVKIAAPLLSGQTTAWSQAQGLVLERIGDKEITVENSKEVWGFEIEGQWTGTRTIVQGAP